MKNIICNIQSPIFNIIINDTSPNNIKKCIKSIKMQNYPPKCVKYYVIDKVKKHKFKKHKNEWIIFLDSRSQFFHSDCLDTISNHIVKHEYSNEYYYTWKFYNGYCVSTFDDSKCDDDFFNYIAVHKSHFDIMDFDAKAKCLDLTYLCNLFTEVCIDSVLVENQSPNHSEKHDHKNDDDDDDEIEVNNTNDHYIDDVHEKHEKHEKHERRNVHYINDMHERHNVRIIHNCDNESDDESIDFNNIKKFDEIEIHVNHNIIHHPTNSPVNIPAHIHIPIHIPVHVPTQVVHQAHQSNENVQEMNDSDTNETNDIIENNSDDINDDDTIDTIDTYDRTQSHIVDKRKHIVHINKDDKIIPTKAFTRAQLRANQNDKAYKYGKRRLFLTNP